MSGASRSASHIASTHKQHIQFHGSDRLTDVITICCVLAFLMQFYYLFSSSLPISIIKNMQLFSWNIVFSSITCASLCYYKLRHYNHHASNFTTIYIISTFTLLINLRLSYYAHMHTCVWLLTAAFFIKVINYCYAAALDIHTNKLQRNYQVRHCSRYEWQLLFVRLFIGFDLVPHFCEKLFAGTGPRMEDVAGFASMHIAHPLFFVILAGLIELGGAFAIGAGFLTRLGALGLSIYLLVASYLGGHFSAGFIWVSTGGGWEYPVMWTTLIFSFSFFGGGGFSLDRVLCERWHIPSWVKFCMGGQR